ncbi:uncharacterized protein LOC131993994, partial [Stomoxys calcitrans]|uniref:uncharacterized protein LOC131993994 n=1 Tax=Stomoxys calcitrans TaxID=35570 RepID=UPI0027E23820
RDAPLVGSSSYHGPSYKYLPPPPQIASGYDSYSTGGHHSLGLGSGSTFGSSGLGYTYSGHRQGAHHGSHYAGGVGSVKLSGGGHGYSGASSFPSHGFAGGHGHGYSGSSSASHGYSGASYPSHSHSGGYSYSGSSGAGSHGYSGASHSFGGGHSVGSSAGHGYSGGAGHSHSHGYPTSSLGHKTVSSAGHGYALSAGHIGSGAGLGSGYHYAKGISGSLPATSSLGHGYSGHGHSSHDFSGHGIAAAVGAASASSHDDHHHHVHNGNQEHQFVVANAGHDAGFDGHSGASDSGYHFEAPSHTYLPPPVPSSSYGVPLGTIGSSYSPKYHDTPAYAAGHKGLGHFGFTNNKPNALHTSFIDSGFKTPAYSKVPFKPSTFLGSKFEGSSAQAPSQQYLPPSGVGAESTGYDYPVPTGPALQFGDHSFQGQALEGSTSSHQPESTYLPPHEVAATPSASYLPPTGNSYGH